MHLHDWLKKSRMTQEEFGDLIGVEGPSVSRYAKSRRMPRREILEKITEVTSGEVTANDFIDDQRKQHTAA